MHTYSLHGGLDRARVGHILGAIAAFVSAAIAAFVAAAADLARKFDWDVPGLILWPLGAFTIYAILYWLFNAYLWKYSRLSELLRVPDLNGEWLVHGQTINPDKSLGYKWGGTATIVQRWGEIQIRLQTPQSGSVSISAALLHDEAAGYRLLYHYHNEPKVGEQELQGHRGFADFLFSRDLTSAEGEYFNGLGRFTFGRMQLTRKCAS